jgi:drug/metabolite transporter (DMT)-like permease
MPVFFLILACALWGLSFPIVRALHFEQSSRLADTDSGFFAAWMQMARFGIGALLLLPFVISGGIATRSEVRQGLLLAFWGGAGMALQADGLAHTPASTSAFLTQAYCVILPLIACIKLRRPLESRVMISTLLVMAGCALLAGLRPGDLRIGRGEAETLLAALFFTFQILTLENPRYAGNRGLHITFVMCLGIAVVFIPVTLMLAPSAAAMISAGASWFSIAMILALALFCTVGAFLLMNHWQPRISATEAGLIYTTEPVFTAVYVLFLPGWISAWTGGSYTNERFGLVNGIGGAFIVLANAILHLKRPPHSAAIAPAP